MHSARSLILDWLERGLIDPSKLRVAFELGGVLPTAAQWRRFLDRLLLWAGTVFVGAAVIFFFAFNWDALDRLAKLGIVEALLLAALGLVWHLGLERAAGKAALLGAALVTGTLLALIGQIYQTGADTFELFAVWAAAILPWTLLARFPALWLLWIVLVNLAVWLYFRTFGWLLNGVFGVTFGAERQLWLLFALNSAALAIWEAGAVRIAWLRERWALRLIATASGALVTAIAARYVLDWRSASGWALPAWLGWLGAVYALYRYRVKDLYALAGGVLSIIVVTVFFLSRHLLERGDAGAFLVIGLVVIGLSAAGGWWLREIATEGA